MVVGAVVTVFISAIDCFSKKQAFHSLVIMKVREFTISDIHLPSIPLNR